MIFSPFAIALQLRFRAIHAWSASYANLEFVIMTCRLKGGTSIGGSSEESVKGGVGGKPCPAIRLPPIVFNGGFEAETTGTILDWKIRQAEVWKYREIRHCSAGHCSLRNRFGGKGKLSLRSRRVFFIPQRGLIMQPRVAAQLPPWVRDHDEFPSLKGMIGLWTFWEADFRWCPHPSLRATLSRRARGRMAR